MNDGKKEAATTQPASTRPITLTSRPHSGEASGRPRTLDCAARFLLGYKHRWAPSIRAAFGVPGSFRPITVR
jgi:hypothetical protein